MSGIIIAADSFELIKIEIKYTLIYRAILTDTKGRFWRNCRNFTCKGLMNKVLEGVALDQEKHFNLIHTIIEAFILKVENEIV